MVSINRFSLAILTILVLSNVLWAYIYFTSLQRETNALKEGVIALAIILAHADTLLREASEKGHKEYLGVAYLLIDHALLVAQTLHRLTGGSSWSHNVVAAVASLHDLLASMYQGYNVSKDKLMKIGDMLEKLVKALKKLDIESIEHYSQELENLTCNS